MKERSINFRNNNNQDIVLDPDGKMSTKLKSIYGKLTMNLGFCHEQLEKGQLTEGMKETHLSLSESYLVEFLKAMDYEGVLAKEKKERYSEIRNLNDENRELRKQLGEKVSNEDAREKMKNISKSIRSWWNIEGFGHTSSIKFSEYGSIEVIFSGMVSRSYYLDDSQTKEGKLERLKELGFDFDKDDMVIHNDKNLDTLKSMFLKKYSSARFNEISLCFRSTSRTYKDISVSITNLDNIII